MGNVYNRHFRNQNLHLQHKSTFLPMLCSSAAIKDTTLPKWEGRPMSIFSTDPLSPKIGCMGQVKRNNKIAGLPASNKLAITTRNSNNVKHSRLKRIFSGKNLNGSTTSIARSTTGLRRSEVVVNGASGPKIDDSKENSVSVSGPKRIFSGKNLNGSTTSIARSTTGLRRSEVVVNGASGPKIDDSKENSVSVSIENMDPPLPVIKKVQQPADGGEANSLWKRRSGGLALKNLQLREIQLNRNNLAPTTA